MEVWNGTYELIPNPAMFRLYGWSFVLSQKSIRHNENSRRTAQSGAMYAMQSRKRLVTPKKKK